MTKTVDGKDEKKHVFPAIDRRNDWVTTKSLAVTRGETKHEY